jgi:hypothetical protein
VCFAVAIVINKLLAAESTKFISVISFGKELYKRRERLSEALQIAKCFE